MEHCWQLVRLQLPVLVGIWSPNLDSLLDYGLITVEERKSLSTLSTDTQAKDLLSTILPKKGLHSYKQFYAMLRETGYGDTLDLLTRLPHPSPRDISASPLPDPSPTDISASSLPSYEIIGEGSEGVALDEASLQRNPSRRRPSSIMIPTNPTVFS